MDIEKLQKLTQKRYELTPLLVAQTKDMGNSFNEIVKVHLLTELFLESLIELAVPEAFDAFKALRLTYKQKIDFASKLYLTAEYSLLDEYTVGSLRQLNKMRNNFSHKLGHSVTDKEIEQLYGGHISDANHLYGEKLPESDQNIAIIRYLFYIFGHMFPKYEFNQNT